MPCLLYYTLLIEVAAVKISEWMQGKKPGEIRLRLEGWHSEKWFKPYSKGKANTWGGINEDLQIVNFLDDEQTWEIYKLEE